MPTPAIWRNDGSADGLHNWALAILKPLEDEGTIRLIDATGYFDADKDAGCADFGDFYHQNAKGRELFSNSLIPQLGE